MIEKPYSPSCEQNKEAILTTLKPLLTSCKTLLEISSGTGQHAVYLAQKMPDIIWQSSDLTPCIDGIKLWLDEAVLNNTPAPISLDVDALPWFNETVHFDAIFSANSLHIMSFASVINFFTGASTILPTAGLLIVYGAFNYNGQYTSTSNAQFDSWLKNRNPLSGIRDFEAVNKLAVQNGFILQSDTTMPANNRILCWQKK